MGDQNRARLERNRNLHRTTSLGARLLAGTVAVIIFFSGMKSASADNLPTVTIGKAVDTIPETFVDVGIAKGFFKKNGVNVKEVLLQGSSVASAAMVGGSLQFAIEGSVPLMLARAHGVPLIAVDGLDDSVTLQFLVSKQWLAKHPVPAGATLKEKMADLNGSVLVQVGSTDPAFFALVRGWAGLPAQRGYRVEAMDSQAAGVVAIQRGIVDVMVASPPQSVQVTQAGLAVDFADRKDISQFNDVTFELMTTTEGYAKKYPQIVRDVATAAAESLNFMREHPDETLTIEQKHFPKLSKIVLQKSLQFIPLSKNGLQYQNDWNRAVTLARETGFVANVKAAPEGVYWTNQYIDMSKLGK